MNDPYENVEIRESLNQSFESSQIMAMKIRKKLK